MDEFLDNLGVDCDQILSSIEKDALLSIYNQDDLNDSKVLYAPPLTTTLRVNTCFYNFEHVRDVIEKINENKWNNQFHISTNIDLFKDIIFIRGFFNNTQTRLDDCVLVDKGCINAVLRGSNVFLPGIIAAPKGIKKNSKISVYGQICNSYTKGCKQFDRSKELFLGNGILTVDSCDIFVKINKSEKGVAIEMTDSLVCQPNFDVIFEEYPSMVFAQNLPSAIVGYVVDPKPHEHILDMCASPGGKTSHLAQLLNNQGKVVAIDKTKSKVKKIMDTVSNLKFTNVTAYVYDSCQLCCDDDQPVTPSPPFKSETFDKVLLDAPCSGLGQRPYLTSRYSTQKELDSFVSQQRKLFEMAVKLTKVDGFIVYSTCTLTVDENENLVAWALKKFANIIQLVPHSPYISHTKIPSKLSPEQSSLIQRFDPILQNANITGNGVVPSEMTLHDTIGFFIAKFKKINCC